jgi:lysophospholipase L1-like esterase
VLEYEPDLIILYNGGNDITQPLSWDPRPGYPFNFLVYENHPLLESQIETYPFLPLVAYGSNLLRYIIPSYFINSFVSLDQLREQVGWQSEEWKNKIVDIYVKNLRKANKISHMFGVKFITFFQPLVYFKEKLHDHEKKMMRPDEKEYVIDMHKKILARIPTSNRDIPLNFVDLSGIYRDDTDVVFRDIIHTSQEKKMTVVHEIYRNLVNNFDIKGLQKTK